MTDIEKAPPKPEEQKKNVNGRGQQAVDPFARLRAAMKKVNTGNLVRGGKLYLTLDASGSMASYCSNKNGQTMPKYEAVANVVRDILTKYHGHVPMEIISFESDAMVVPDINGYEPGGGTNIHAALLLLTQHGSQAVLLSDGDTSCENEIRQEDIPRLAADQITVNCIGVGVNGSGEQILREIAAGTGGSYVGIDADLALIFETFKQLTSRAVAALTAGQGVIAAGSGQ